MHGWKADFFWSKIVRTKQELRALLMNVVRGYWRVPWLAFGL
jgi:hypothetical protein